MVNELRALLRDNAATAPHEDDDLSAVLRGGRRRVQRRRITALGGTAAAGLAVVGLGSLVWPGPVDLDVAGVPSPSAPTLHLADAKDAVRGGDYRVLASYTNDNLQKDNGQYFDGVTDDGLVLFRDGPRIGRRQAQLALLDPATGDKTRLPAPPVPGDGQLWPTELGATRLVFTGLGAAGADPLGGSPLFAVVYDRDTDRWRRVAWPELPAVDQPAAASLAPDGRLYVRVPATSGTPPPGGWPTGPDGEADDADAAGDTYALWSVSLSDPTDVRDERLTVGSLAFAGDRMVWTDSTNGHSGLVHVRDLATGEERAFDPRSGARCNLLSFGATEDRIVLGQYCGTYDDGVRDDRVQVLGADGAQVVTIQDSDLDGSMPGDSGLVTVTSHQPGRSGTYVYDLGTGGFLRISTEVSSWALGGPTPQGRFLWDTPANRGRGATQWLGSLVD